MERFSVSPVALLRSVLKHRDLILVLAHREIVGRYKGSYFGLLWSIAHPLMMLGIYTFVFSVVFRARWGDGPASKAEFALVLYCGLLVFNIFSEVINRSPSLILSNVNYVKKVVFPLEILSWVNVLTATFHSLIGFAVWLLFYVTIFGLPPLTALLLPFVLAPLLLTTLGMSWFLASLGVYIRDVSQLVGVATTALMFLSPIFFPLTAVPEEYRLFMTLNPLTPVVESARAVLIWGRPPELAAFLVSFLISALMASAGFAWFQKTRKGFSDVL